MPAAPHSRKRNANRWGNFILRFSVSIRSRGLSSWHAVGGEGEPAARHEQRDAGPVDCECNPSHKNYLGSLLFRFRLDFFGEPVDLEPLVNVSRCCLYSGMSRQNAFLGA